MATVLTGLARRLGAPPAQVVGLLASLVLAAYAAWFLLGDPSLLRVLVWFVGAALVHDLVLFPLYTALDRALVTAARGRVPLVNHVRVPALGAGLALLMFWPGIVRQGAATHLAATGLDQSPYLGRWLGLSAVLFGASAVLYLVRVAVDGVRHRAGRVETVPDRTPPADPMADPTAAPDGEPARRGGRTPDRHGARRVGGVRRDHRAIEGKTHRSERGGGFRAMIGVLIAVLVATGRWARRRKG